MEEEPLMSFRPKTLEEKIVWLEYEKKKLVETNSLLNIELGIMQSEIDELKDLMKHEEKGVLILKNKRLTTQIKDMENRIKDLKKENELFLQKIIKLQTP
jgi:hypothetical protein